MGGEFTYQNGIPLVLTTTAISVSSCPGLGAHCIGIGIDVSNLQILQALLVGVPVERLNQRKGEGVKKKNAKRPTLLATCISPHQVGKLNVFVFFSWGGGGEGLFDRSVAWLRFETHMRHVQNQPDL